MSIKHCLEVFGFVWSLSHAMSSWHVLPWPLMASTVLWSGAKRDGVFCQKCCIHLHNNKDWGKTVTVVCWWITRWCVCVRACARVCVLPCLRPSKAPLLVSGYAKWPRICWVDQTEWSEARLPWIFTCRPRRIAWKLLVINVSSLQRNLAPVSAGSKETGPAETQKASWK